MLTSTDRLRLQAQNLEFYTPPALVPLASKVFGVGNPYTEKDDKLEALFLHVPKTAGSSIRRALWGEAAYHIPASRYYAYDKQKFNSYFTFCFVRNPWSRLCSAYHYLQKRVYMSQEFLDHRWAQSFLKAADTFSSFVNMLQEDSFRNTIKRYTHFRDQLDWITIPGKRDTIIVKHIAKYEDIDREYKFLQSKFNVGIILPHVRPGGYGDDWRKMYDSKMVDIVQSMYKKDIKCLGYDFE